MIKTVTESRASPFSRMREKVARRSRPDEGWPNIPAKSSSMPRYYSDHQLSQARHLRHEMTNAETMLWKSLRNRGIGLKFRRQVPIGPYIADFACIEAKLIVELDGPPHDDPSQMAHDARRDSWLRAQGWFVLRVSNDLVMGGGNIILDEIKRAIGPVTSPSSGQPS